MLIGYDRRGSGLSDRDVVDYSLDAQVLDLEAIVDRLGIRQFALFAGLFLGPAAIAYATRHPDNVTHLLLWCTSPRAPSRLSDARFDLLDPLMETDWERYTETRVHWTVGWDNPEEARKYAALLRKGSTPESFRAYQQALSESDASALLKEVRSPTLVLHMRDGSRLGFDAARQLASEIPGARLTAVEGSLPYPWMGRQESALTAIDEFLGDAPLTNQPAAATPSSFRTILFTDLVGHAEMMQRLGDDKGRDVLRAHERITRETLKEYAGAEVKTMGDGFMASFGSVTKAMDCAIALQRAFATHTESMPEPLNVRVGLNAGEPIGEDGDLFGSTVILASRIAAQAGAGEILIPELLRHLLSGKSYVYSDRGDVALKGFEEPVRLYEVRWRGD